MVLRIFSIFCFILFCQNSFSSKIESQNLSDLVARLQPLDDSNSLPVKNSTKKDVVLYFWATWCPDCKAKLTSLFQQKELYEKYDVYLIATDKESEKIQHFQKKFSIFPQIAIDPERQVQKALKVFSVPTVVFLERTGNELKHKKTQTGGDFNL